MTTICPMGMPGAGLTTVVLLWDQEWSRGNMAATLPTQEANLTIKMFVMFSLLLIIIVNIHLNMKLRLRLKGKK